MRSIALAALLLAGCAGVGFDVPHASAVEQCQGWADAIEARMQECQFDPAFITERMARRRAACERVLYVNPLGRPVSECIADVRKIPCGEDHGEWCSAFVTGD